MRLRIWQLRELLYVLVRRDLLVRYQSSVFGFLWSFAKPLLLVVIFGVVFNIILRGGGTPDPGRVPLGIHILIGVLTWTFLAGSVTEGQHAVLSHANLIKKVKIPVAIFPSATVVGNLINFLLGMLIVIPVVLIMTSGEEGTPWGAAPLKLLMFLGVTALLVLLAETIVLFVSATQVYFRDTSSLVEVLLQAWFYATPIVYPLHLLYDKGEFLIGGPRWNGLAETVYLLNPMATICLAYRRILLYRPTVGLEVPDALLWRNLALTALVTLLLFGLSRLFFRRLSRGFADEL